MPREMPAFTKAPPELVERFGAVLDRVATPDTQRRQMFGYPCAFVGGNMATGLFQDAWWVRLPEDRLSAVLASGEGRPFEPMPGRPMKGYAVLPDEIVGDDGDIEAWVGRALAYTATLPAKDPTPRKKKP
ncbi:MAG: TfoX/Sxy family protein [Chloroflexi bacterium]|nr:TfoX/Sxy family protein [Chloroflexota bacterium]